MDSQVDLVKAIAQSLAEGLLDSLGVGVEQESGKGPRAAAP
jgi:hypothetical protein